MSVMSIARMARFRLNLPLAALLLCSLTSCASEPQVVERPLPRLATAQGSVTLEGDSNFVWNECNDPDGNGWDEETDLECSPESGEIGDSCSAAGAFAGTGEGASVSIEERNGDVLGSGSLGSGYMTDGDSGFVGDFGCKFTFAIRNVPTTHSETDYRVEISGLEPIYEFKSNLFRNGLEVRAGKR